MTEFASDPRAPRMGAYEGHTQWHCQWPGCAFDTLEEAAWTAHIDPITGPHKAPRRRPGLNTSLSPDERAELNAFRAAAEVAASPPPEPPKVTKAKGQ